MKKLTAALLFLVLAFSMAACMGPKEVAYVTTAPVETEGETVPPPAQPETEGFSYEILKNDVFYFSSGAGGWFTRLYIHADGSFSGSFTDSNMGESGEGYTGTEYRCDFTGRFGSPEHVDRYTLRLPIQELCPEEARSEIVGGVLRRYGGEPYGLEGTKELLLYLPGAPLEELPEQFLRWVDLYGTQEKELPFCGLYNEPQENGFSSYNEIALLWDAVAAAQEQDAQLKNAMTQADMNVEAYDRYALWDGLLNQIWQVLMNRMTGEEKQALISEELAWIAEKEAAILEAGKEVEGGTLYPAVTNAAAANWTRERVYVLMTLLEETA